MTQSCVAIEGAAGEWFLVNASPDLPAQIHSNRDLHPRSGAPRGSPISGILLTNSDLDHVLGLLFMREGRRLRVHATDAVRETLSRSLGVTAVLNAFCGIEWRQPPLDDFAPLSGENGERTSLVYRAIALPGGPPFFAEDNLAGGVHSVAFQVMDRDTGGRLLVAPDVAACNEALAAALQDSDAVLFDGTFWSDDELSRIKAGARTAAQMGHLTIKEHSLALLAKLPAKHRIYIHINNTNPVLRPDSPEQAAVTAAGIEVGCDGMEFEV